MANIIRVLIDQPKYDVISNKGNSYLEKSSELQVQTKQLLPGMKPSDLESKGYKLNPDSGLYERPKIGGVIEDNINEILGFVYEPSKYDNDGMRKPEYYIPYDWSVES